MVARGRVRSQSFLGTIIQGEILARGNRPTRTKYQSAAASTKLCAVDASMNVRPRHRPYGCPDIATVVKAEAPLRQRTADLTPVVEMSEVVTHGASAAGKVGATDDDYDADTLCADNLTNNNHDGDRTTTRDRRMKWRAQNSLSSKNGKDANLRLARSLHSGRDHAARRGYENVASENGTIIKAVGRSPRPPVVYPPPSTTLNQSKILRRSISLDDDSHDRHNDRSTRRNRQQCAPLSVSAAADLLMKRDGRGTTSTDNLAMKGNDLSPTLSLPKSSRGLLQRLASIRTGGGIIGGTGGRRGRRPLLSVEARRSLEGGGGGPAEEEQQGPPLLRGKSYTWDNNGTDMASILRDPEFHRSHDWAVA